jgi:hypothetical protein
MATGKYKFDWNKVKEDVKQQDKKGFVKDERFWRPTLDDKGNATAIIRFLPDQDGTPWAKIYTHNFNYMADGVKKYWIQNCLNTFGYDRECPICKKNQEYWNSSFDSDKKIASARKRKLEYTSNILVIKNPANPEDEGKVFLLKYGIKIFDKIKEKMFPSDEMKSLGEGMYEEYIPFDLYDGANFIYVQKKQGDYPNFDNSKFDVRRPLGNEEKIGAVMSKVYDLSPFMEEDKFPTNEKVISTLGAILGLTASDTNQKPEPKKDDNSDLFTDDNNIPDSFPTASGTDDQSDNSGGDDVDSDDEDFFKNLK